MTMICSNINYFQKNYFRFYGLSNSTNATRITECNNFVTFFAGIAMRRKVERRSSAAVRQQARPDGRLALGQDRRGSGTPHHQGQGVADPGMFGHQWGRGQGGNGVGLQERGQIVPSGKERSLSGKCSPFPMSCISQIVSL